ncbi:MAG: asparaginase [Pseudobacteriovorax sp.]|nr:asparaginase [Pseudobacteriovorax sp.]
MDNGIMILTAGGTIDKVYFDANSEFQVGEPQIAHILRESRIAVPYQIESILQKDSLDLTDEDRALIYSKVSRCKEKRIIITHGTDTMAETAKLLSGIDDKVCVFTGSMEPAKIKSSDAAFNVGCALAAVQLLPPGSYIAMNGKIFNAVNVRKNLAKKTFEVLTPEDNSNLPQ